MKRYWPLIAFCAVNAFIILVLFRSGIYHNSSMEQDLSIFFNYSSAIVNGSLPYRAFTAEYPPLAFIFFTIPRLFASTPTAYHYAFIVELLVFNTFGLFILYKLSERLRINSNVTLAIYTILLLAIGPILIYRYDLIPAVIVLAFLFAFSLERYNFCWAILALGAMTKIYPAVIAPILLLYQLSRRRYREAIRGIGVFVITVAVIITPFVLLSPNNLLDSFIMQAQRGLHADSLYSSLLLLGQNFGLTTVRIYVVTSTPISVDVVSSAATFLAKIALGVMALALGTIYYLFYRRSKSTAQIVPFDERQAISSVINYSFLTVIVFMLTNKVFSPQFIIWLFPIVPLVTHRWKQVPWIMIMLVGLLTYYLFPLNYNSFYSGKHAMVYILLARNALLVLLSVWLIAWENTVAELQPQKKISFIFQPVAVVATLVIITGSILCTQIIWNRNNNQSSTLPRDMSAYFYANRGDMYLHMGKYDKAIADNYKAIELDPQYTEAYNNRGYLYILTHEYSKAISDASMAIQIDPTYANAYDTRAEAYWNMGEYDKAIADSNKAIELNANEAYYYRNRGIAYKLKGEYDEAIVDLQKCIELSKDQSLTQEAQRILEEIKGIE